MKKRVFALLLSLSLLLSGCSWLDGSYVSITPRQGTSEDRQDEQLTAQTYTQLLEQLEKLVDAGEENAVILLPEYSEEVARRHMISVDRHIRKVYPLGAYAVEKMTCEVGSSNGKTAVAVSLSYSLSRAELRRIRSVRTMENAAELVGEALSDLDTALVMRIEQFSALDFSQTVQDYARENPQTVMETPQVVAEVFGEGRTRVVELTFVYQTSRDSLRTMQNQVKPIFDAAVLYVSGEGSQSQKFSQLYGFLMERFDYTLETSITPAYSLLQHGVGDSRAFAVVYGAMCRAAGLECLTVTGTRNGEPWTWNMIGENGKYYHVDLLRSGDSGFRRLVDAEMTGYVWDYSAYPVCEYHQAPAVETPEAGGTDATEATEETLPVTEATEPAPTETQPGGEEESAPESVPTDGPQTEPTAAATEATEN